MGHEKTAVVINDEIGELALAFQMEKFQVLGDVLQQEENIDIVLQNQLIPTYKMTSESFKELPEADVLAGRLSMGKSIAGADWKCKIKNEVNNNILKYMQLNRPKFLFLETANSLREDVFSDFINRITSLGYDIHYERLDICAITGMPLRGKRIYFVGSRRDLGIEFSFPVTSNWKMSWEEIFRINEKERYISLKQVSKIRYEGDGVYTLKQDGYQKTEIVSLGQYPILILKNGMVRKLSVKEMMLLKGLPQDYKFNGKSDSWIKRVVARSANMILCRMFAKELGKNMWEEKEQDKYLQISGKEEREEKSRQDESVKKEKAKKTVTDDREEKNMERRYDVFVSSTYEDLIEERKEITQAVLECDCMPVGMEMFPASNMAQWDFIKKVIDKADIYLVIVAGRYGSLGKDTQGTQISYTEMEYNYAKSKGKPILAFLHKDLNRLTRDKIELDSGKAAALEAFRERIKNDRMVKFFANKDELKANAISGINSMKKQLTAGGWVRAGQMAAKPSSNITMQKLMLENENLLKQLQNAQKTAKEAGDREKSLRLQYENVKEKIKKLAEEI